MFQTQWDAAVKMRCWPCGVPVLDGGVEQTGNVKNGMTDFANNVLICREVEER